MGIHPCKRGGTSSLGPGQLALVCWCPCLAQAFPVLVLLFSVHINIVPFVFLLGAQYVLLWSWPALVSSLSSANFKYSSFFFPSFTSCLFLVRLKQCSHVSGNQYIFATLFETAVASLVFFAIVRQPPELHLSVPSYVA